MLGGFPSQEVLFIQHYTNSKEHGFSQCDYLINIFLELFRKKAPTGKNASSMTELLQEVHQVSVQNGFHVVNIKDNAI